MPEPVAAALLIAVTIAYLVGAVLLVAALAKVGPYPRNLDTVGDYAAVGSVAARRAS